METSVADEETSRLFGPTQSAGHRYLRKDVACSTLQCRPEAGASLGFAANSE